MPKKKRDPFAHTGKVFPLRSIEEIEDQAKNTGQAPTLDFFKAKILEAASIEQKILESLTAEERNDPSVVLRRAAIRECIAFMSLVEKHSQMPQDAIGSRYLAYNAMQLAWKISLCCYRPLEPHVVAGWELHNRGKDLSKSRSKAKFKISRDQLLKEIEYAHQQNPNLTQIGICNLVAKSHKVSGETIRKSIQLHGIRAAEYKTPKQK